MEEMHSGVHLHSRVTLTFIPTRGRVQDHPLCWLRAG